MATKKKSRPLNSLLASAQRITAGRVRGKAKVGSAEQWQMDAWDMYDLVGEERFLATTLANRVGQARLFVGRLPNALTSEPIEVVAVDETEGGETQVDVSDESATGTEEDIPADVLLKVLETFGGSPAGRAQLLERMSLNLFVAGDGWYAGIPNDMLEEAEEGEDGSGMAHRIEPGDDDEEVALEDLEWYMLSVQEVVSSKSSDDVTMTLADGTKLEVSPDDIYLIRVWRSHPKEAWKADSPTRSSLPVLRELVGLTQHISANIDSRLAGAGLLLVPESAAQALRVSAGLPATPTGGDDDDVEDPFTEALMEAMLKPIANRDSASAVVPLVATVPDESAQHFKHLSFSTTLDKEAQKLRDEAIRRLALGQDAPPELLLGTAGMNHWGAWLVNEDVVTTHITPPLALICDALTTQYLWPVLEQMDYEPDIVHQYVVWFDIEHMIIRPNRSADAKDLFDAGVISAKAYRDAAGFEETDAPAAELAAIEAEENKEEDEEKALRKAAGMKALDLAIANPMLVVDPGLPAIAEQVYSILSGEALAEQEVGDDTPPSDEAIEDAADTIEDDGAGGPLPETDQDEATPPGFAGDVERGGLKYPKAKQLAHQQGGPISIVVDDPARTKAENLLATAEWQARQKRRS
jgi:hypothetical protein